jgi:hypothetical protein
VLSQAHRRSIHTSLTPVLGEEETDALMSEFPASESDMPVGAAHFDATIKDLRHEMQLGFSGLETKIEETMKDGFRTMIFVMASALVGGMALSAAIAAGIAQAVGGG